MSLKKLTVVSLVSVFVLSGTAYAGHNIYPRYSSNVGSPEFENDSKNDIKLLVCDASDIQKSFVTVESSQTTNLSNFITSTGTYKFYVLDKADTTADCATAATDSNLKVYQAVTFYDNKINYNNRSTSHQVFSSQRAYFSVANTGEHSIYLSINALNWKCKKLPAEKNTGDMGGKSTATAKHINNLVPGMGYKARFYKSGSDCRHNKDPVVTYNGNLSANKIIYRKD